MATRKRQRETDPGSEPIALALATIVHRVMSRPRGMRLVDIEREFDVTRRTRNKWVKRLQEEFPPFASGTGGVRLERVGKGAEESITAVLP